MINNKQWPLLLVPGVRLLFGVPMMLSEKVNGAKEHKFPFVAVDHWAWQFCCLARGTPQDLETMNREALERWGEAHL